MLARRLAIALPQTPPSVANRVADWCTHEFRVGRYRYLMFCNTTSLYPVVSYARGVNDEHSLIERLVDALQASLTGADLEFQFRRQIAPESAVVQWAPIPDKAILGSINDMINMTRYSLENRDEAPADLSRWLARSPMSVLGGNSPDRVFPRLGR